MELPENWQEIRQNVLIRDSYRCIKCNSTDNLHIHHIYQKYFGGSHQLSNLITLCDKCHSDQHIELQVGLSRKSFEFVVYNFQKLISFFSDNKNIPINYYPLLRLLTGKSSFLNGQKDVIDEILKGKNVLVIRPTGSGKGLIYQLPSLISKEPSIIIEPLKALMKDQVEKLWKRGIPVTFINSDLSKIEKEERIKLFQKNAFKLLYLAPERFDRNLIFNEDEINRLTNIKIKYLIIDEAHIIEEWGYSFREIYREIDKIKRLYNNPQIIAGTATATPYVRNEIIDSVNIDNPKIFIQGFDRPNIIIHVTKIRNRNPKYELSDKIRELLYLLGSIDQSKKTIIYVPTIKIGNKILERLQTKNYQVEFFNGKLDSKQKSDIQNRFTGISEPKFNLLVSTNAFGMGIDIPNIRYVIHWTQPKSINSYYQEIGRAGRDKNPSLAILLKVNQDENLINFMIRKTLENSKLSPDKKRTRYTIEKNELKKILDFAKFDKCLRKYIHEYFGSNYTSPKKSFLVRLFYYLFNRKQKDIKYCCTNCDRLYNSRKLKKVFRMVNKF